VSAKTKTDAKEVVGRLLILCMLASKPISAEIAVGAAKEPYRPAARRPQMVDTGMSHIGFRCVMRPG
jgi:hypothetical protein